MIIMIKTLNVNVECHKNHIHKFLKSCNNMEYILIYRISKISLTQYFF